MGNGDAAPLHEIDNRHPALHHESKAPGEHERPSQQNAKKLPLMKSIDAYSNHLPEDIG